MENKIRLASEIEGELKDMDIGEKIKMKEKFKILEKR